MIEFVGPQSNGEWLAWISALYLVLSGLLMLLVPGWWLSLGAGTQSAGTRAQCAPDPQTMAAIRGPLAGGNIGFGLVVLALHPQPLLYLALGGSLLFGTAGRLASIFIDKGNSAHCWVFLIIEGLLAFFSLAYFFGIIA